MLMQTVSSFDLVLALKYIQKTYASFLLRDVENNLHVSSVGEITEIHNKSIIKLLEIHEWIYSVPGRHLDVKQPHGFAYLKSNRVTQFILFYLFLEKTTAL